MNLENRIFKAKIITEFILTFENKNSLVPIR